MAPTSWALLWITLILLIPQPFALCGYVSLTAQHPTQIVLPCPYRPPLLDREKCRRWLWLSTCLRGAAPIEQAVSQAMGKTNASFDSIAIEASCHYFCLDYYLFACGCGSLLTCCDCPTRSLSESSSRLLDSETTSLYVSSRVSYRPISPTTQSSFHLSTGEAVDECRSARNPIVHIHLFEALLELTRALLTNTRTDDGTRAGRFARSCFLDWDPRGRPGWDLLK